MLKSRSIAIAPQRLALLTLFALLTHLTLLPAPVAHADGRRGPKKMGDERSARQLFGTLEIGTSGTRIKTVDGTFTVDLSQREKKNARLHKVADGDLVWLRGRLGGKDGKDSKSIVARTLWSAKGDTAALSGCEGGWIRCRLQRAAIDKGTLRLTTDVDNISTRPVDLKILKVWASTDPTEVGRSVRPPSISGGSEPKAVGKKSLRLAKDASALVEWARTRAASSKLAGKMYITVLVSGGQDRFMLRYQYHLGGSRRR